MAPKKSAVWNYFTVHSKEGNKVRCNLCFAVLSVKRFSTSSMTRHLILKHSSTYISRIRRRVLQKESKNDPPIKKEKDMESPSSKETARRSDVWNYFIRDSEDKTRVKCNVCSAVLAINGGSTSSMIRHLKLRHPTIKVVKLYSYVRDEESGEDDDDSYIKNDFKKKKGRSAVWKYFTKSTSNETRVKCNVCSAFLSVKRSSTSSMIRHLHLKHPTIKVSKLHRRVPYEDSEDINTPIKIEFTDTYLSNGHSWQDNAPTSSSTDNTLQSIANVSFCSDPLIISEQEAIDEQLLNFIVTDYQPFNIVHSDNFQKLVSILNPNYQLPNKKTLSNSLSTAYETCLAKVKTEIEKVAYIAITTDEWTSINNERFFAITGHFVDENCAIQSRMLSTLKLLEQPTSEQLKLVLSEWHLDDKVVACVTNNEAAQLGKWWHIPCFVHSLNLVVQSGFCEIYSTLQKVRSIVEFFKKSELQNNEILKLDNRTRWNSTYDMLYRMNKAKEFLQSTTDSSFPLLNLEDWNIIEKCCKILTIFNEIAIEISREKNVMLSKVAVLTKTLISYCNRLKLEKFDSPLVKNMVEKIHDEVMTRFKAKYRDINIIWEATFLDPRFRQYGFHDEHILKQTKENMVNECFQIRRHDEETIPKPEEPEDQSECSSIWSIFDSTVEKLAEKGENSRRASIAEVENYCQMPLLSRTSDPLLWWNENKQLFPNLFEIMKQRLCVPAAAIPCERAFSKKGEIVADRRRLASSGKIAKLVFLNSNFEHL